MTVRELLRVRDTDAGGQRGVLDNITLQSSALTGEAIDLLLNRNLSGLVVLKGDAQVVVGLVTERELLRFGGNRETVVEDAMIPLREVHSVEPADSVKKCIDLYMASHQRAASVATLGWICGR